MTDNAIRHARRSLLDFVDLQIATQQQKADLVFWEVFKKRIHNDLSMLKCQMEAVVEIVRNDGVIPPFGRTEEQRARDEEAKAKRGYLQRRQDNGQGPGKNQEDPGRR